MNKNGLALITSIILLCVPQPAHADLRSDVSRCAEIDSSITRLICYDEMADRYKLTTQTETPHSPGKWRSKISTSKVDDSRTVTLFLNAEEEVPFGKNQKTRPTLIVRCLENRTALYIIYDGFLGSDTSQLTYRIDKEKARTAEWSISTDHRVIGLWHGGSSIPFIKKLIKNNTFLVRVQPYSESPVLTSFKITVLGQAIKPLREACSW